ncbi:putative Holliday junction resolvase [Acetoanaerobium pronyense]|uniref:Putative pre-16S rRNA nuclease n=1 Tax=Acetoanaerobium pronyense TaxID=1482736 RepID=A0ABS4KJ34_9FIRM|nr:Holliday junction resolvase RuvX [Acetoanaerobium pronyense]MBP2027794.1 putative Holliday junction resolvase [Acetoanaerobium pronyense]
MEKILCLDVGEKRIGIALSDLLGLTAQPLYTLKRKNTKDAIREICDIIQRESIKKAVIGLPKNMDGSEGFQAEITKKFSETLKKHADIEIIFWDERLTSALAKRSLSHMKIGKAKEKNLIDTAAAVHILQSYLDRINMNK